MPEMTKTQTAVSFLHLASGGKVKEAYAEHVHPDFRHHNPHFKGDRASLMQGMQEGAAEFPRKIFEVLRTVEEGDLVAVHGRVRLKPGWPWIALMHFFRFRDDLIVDEWEAAQEAPKDGPNKNGVF